VKRKTAASMASVVLVVLALFTVLGIAASATVPLSITTIYLPVGPKGAGYTATLQAAGGTPPYTWSSTPSFTDGLKLNGKTGEIVGTPTKLGTTHFVITAKDATGQTVSKALPLYIVVPFPTDVVVLTKSVPDGQVGDAYSFELHGKGGTPPYLWGVTTSVLPPGLQFEGYHEALIYGTPTKAGTYKFGVTDNDNAGEVAFGNYTMVIKAASSSFPLWADALIGLAIVILLAILVRRIRPRTT
jgi:hypothetical protein